MGAEGTPVILLNVLEALEVQAQHRRQHFDLEPLLRLLQPRAGIAKEFVLRIQSLCGAAPSTWDHHHLEQTLRLACCSQTAHSHQEMKCTNGINIIDIAKRRE